MALSEDAGYNDYEYLGFIPFCALDTSYLLMLIMVMTQEAGFLLPRWEPCFMAIALAWHRTSRSLGVRSEPKDGHCLFAS